MGTSEGNYGRGMYKDLAWKKAVSEKNKLKRIRVEKKCPNCGSLFIIVRTIDKKENIRVSKKEKKFCSRKCANIRFFTEKQNKSKGRPKPFIKKKCLFCEEEFFIKRNNQLFCSCSCSSKNRYKNLDKDSYIYYRNKCSFNFNLSDFPEEFNFSLIEEFGWYKAKNKGNNLKGVSRDHIISVKYGWKNSISHEIISHPANCQLMIHNENVSKGEKCDLTLEDLMKKIKEWDEKYGPVA